MLEVLSQKEITVVFANIEDILLTNTVSEATMSNSNGMLITSTGFPEFARGAPEGMSSIH